MVPGTAAKVYVLRSSDNVLFNIEEAVAAQLLTIKQIVDADCAQSPILMVDISGEVLGKVLAYCKRHAEAHGDGAADVENLKAFDAYFVNVNQAMLFEIMMAANYLEITSLIELVCQAVAEKMKGKTPEEIRTMFNIKNDFTPEEEEEIRKETAWAFK